MHDLIPGILEKTPEEIEKKLQIIKPFSKVVHVDIIDGKFATNESYNDPNFFKKYANDFFMEVHLMVEDPTSYLKQYAAAGFKRFLGHIEKMKDINEFVARGQILGEVGIALDNNTGVNSLTIPPDDLDVVLLMSVKAGESGQQFQPQVLDKIKAIREKSQITIQVDGGINDKTIIEAKNAGANRFITTSFIFNSLDPMESFEKLAAIV